ncbi:MAG: CvpA family protein, partial [Anaerolineales bacterium]|nr:CvpA family protein [Anaerolineales bacterium]
LFWVMVVFFALIGTLRGWTKEAIAMAGLMLSLFALNLASSTSLINLLIDTSVDVTVLTDTTILANYNSDLPVDTVNATAIATLQREFYVLVAIHLVIAFFAYQGPTLAGGRVGERLRVRDSVQNWLLGMLLGGVNGYLIFGTLWSFLEYRITVAGSPRLAAGYNYAFYPMIQRPLEPFALQILEYLPLPMLSPFLPYLIVGMFLFVIIVFI